MFYSEPLGGGALSAAAVLTTYVRFLFAGGDLTFCSAFVVFDWPLVEGGFSILPRRLHASKFVYLGLFEDVDLGFTATVLAGFLPLCYCTYRVVAFLPPPPPSLPPAYFFFT